MHVAVYSFPPCIFSPPFKFMCLCKTNNDKNNYQCCLCSVSLNKKRNNVLFTLEIMEAYKAQLKDKYCCLSWRCSGFLEIIIDILWWPSPFLSFYSQSIIEFIVKLHNAVARNCYKTRCSAALTEDVNGFQLEWQVISLLNAMMILLKA